MKISLKTFLIKNYLKFTKNHTINLSAFKSSNCEGFILYNNTQSYYSMIIPYKND